MDIYTATITLLIVLDPLGNIPILLSLLNRVDPKKRRQYIISEVLFAYLTLICFLIGGKHILASLNITQPALGIAGGILLFMISIKMIFPDEPKPAFQASGEPFIVPLAIPLIAGPSSIATILLLVTKFPYHQFNLLIAITLALLISGLLFLCSKPLSKILGIKGLTAIERLMGMILTVVSVQMFLSGVQGFLQTLPK